MSRIEELQLRSHLRYASLSNSVYLDQRRITYQLSHIACNLHAPAFPHRLISRPTMNSYYLTQV